MLRMVSRSTLLTTMSLSNGLSNHRLKTVRKNRDTADYEDMFGAEITVSSTISLQSKSRRRRD